MALDDKTISKVKAKAEKYFDKGKYESAFETYEKISDYGEKDPRIYIRIGDIARRAGLSDKALDYYTKAAERFAKQGFIVKAIAVCKMVINIDPSREDMQKRLATLCEGSGSVGAVKAPSAVKAPMPPPMEVPPDDAVVDDAIIDPGGTDMEFIEAPMEFVEDEAGVEEAEVLLPRTPLFSDFNKEELLEMVRKLRHIHVDAGEVIFEQGSEGASIYIIVEGETEVVGKGSGGDEVRIATLKGGDFFGEFGFFANSMRLSTVRAVVDTELLELTRSDMDEIIKTHARVSDVVFDFYKERVVDRLMAISRVFRPMSEEDRKGLLGRLTLATFDDGQEVMSEGEKGDTMYLSMSGAALVSVRDMAGSTKEITELKEGDFFGEVALATTKPRVATVTAKGKLETVVFSKAMIKEVLIKYPEIKKILQGVIMERITDAAKAKAVRAAVMV